MPVDERRGGLDVYMGEGFGVVYWCWEIWVGHAGRVRKTGDEVKATNAVCASKARVSTRGATVLLPRAVDVSRCRLRGEGRAERG